jgi:hypothetical protein
VSRNYWVAPLPPFHTADGTAYTGTAALGDLSPAPPLLIPARLLEAGSRLEFQAFGRYTSTATPGTVTVGLYLGPPASAIGSVTAVAVTASLTVQASQTNRSWRVEGNGSIRAVGSGTSAQILALLEVSNITTNGTDLAPATAPAVATFDSTVDNSVRIGVTPSVTTGSWQLQYFGVRLVN